MAENKLPKWQEPNYDMDSIKQQANDYVMPGVNTQLTGIENQKNTATTNFNQTKENLMSDYAKRVTGIQTDTKLGKNTFANNANSRGLGRSSIVMGGLEDIGIRGEKRTDETYSERDKYIGQAQGQYDTMLQNLEQQRTTVETNKQSALQDYINQLKEQQYARSKDTYDMDYRRSSDMIAQQERQQQFEQQAMQWEKEYELNMKEFEAQKEYQKRQLNLQEKQLAAQRAAQAKAAAQAAKKKAEEAKAKGDATFKYINDSLKKSGSSGNAQKYAIDVGNDVRKDYGSDAQSYLRNRGRQYDLLYQQSRL